MVELLSEMDSDGAGGPRVFYDHLCEAVCRLTSMERAGLLLYDDVRKLVVPAGSHGLGPELLKQVHGTLEETPIARRALAEDRVVVASRRLEEEIPPRYASLLGDTTLTCTPVSAAGRWLGVILADRGGGRFELTDGETNTMWTLGKTAALAASARQATEGQERARVLDERISLAQEVHERVMQRLFGVSLVLGADLALGETERKRCAEEIRGAVGDLRLALARPVVPAARISEATLRDELSRLDRHYANPPLEVDWVEGVEVPTELEPLAQSVLAEALRNVHKHAEPKHVRVRIWAEDDAFALEVRNDGVIGPSHKKGAGMGLHLAALDALQRGGVVEFGAADGDEWRVRLVVPLADEEGTGDEVTGGDS